MSRETEADTRAAEIDDAKELLRQLERGGKPQLLMQYLDQIETALLPTLKEISHDKIKMSMFLSALTALYMRGILALSTETAKTDIIDLDGDGQITEEDAFRLVELLTISHAQEYLAIQHSNNVGNVRTVMRVLSLEAQAHMGEEKK